tara:strand:+ start:561 stop:1445 length:885 start_codon:yes stop_codon:yes gene_type:complete
MKKIFLTFDIDPDFFFLKNKKYSWKGFECGVIDLYNLLQKKFKTEINITWFLRIDDEIEHIHGRADYLYHKYFKIIKFIKSKNGLICLHPHLTKKVSSKIWQNNVEDKTNLIQLKKIFKIAKKLKFVDSEIIRFGNFHFSQKILNFLIKQNVKVDSSSFPGRKDFLWKNSPKKPFYFEKKYRISEKFFDKNKAIIEVPVTTYKVKAEYDKYKRLRYLDLTAKNKIFKKNFNNINLDATYFVCLSHPGNLVNLRINHGFLGFGVNNFIKNLDLLKKKLESLSKKNVLFENLKYFK